MAALTNYVEERLGFGALANLPGGVSVQFAEAGVAVDAPEKGVTRAVGEGLQFTDESSFDGQHFETEALAISPLASRDITGVQARTLTITETHLRAGDLIRETARSLTLTPAYLRQITIAVSEAISFTTRLVRAANGLFHDIAVRNRGMGADEIVQHARGLAPADYRPFATFLPGDYTFQEAWVAIRLSAPLGVDTPAIYEATMNVDLPDVIEKGRVNTVVISSPANDGWVSVTLAKTFSQIPEVVTTPISGVDPVIVETRNITATAFEVRTLKASDRTPTSAAVSWTAVGI